MLKDLARQTFSDFNILVIDAGSKDKTCRIANRFKKVKVIISRKANVSYQRNLGGKNALAKYLLFIDADVRLPRFFLEGLKYHLSVQEADLFTCWLEYGGKKQADKVIVALFNFLSEAGKFFEAPAGFGTMIGCRKNVFAKLGGFDPEITYAEDTEFVQRAFKKGYRFEIYKNPRARLSLRRFRKEGTLPLLRKYAKLNLSLLINGFPKVPKKEYPMIGGSYYRKSKAYPRLVSRIDKILFKLKRINRKRLYSFIENFFLD